MKRRNFLQLIAALAGVPFLPKTAAKPVHFIGQNSIANTRNDVIETVKTGIPVGTVQPYMGRQAPLGWLPCDGRVISAHEFPALHAAIGQPGKIPFRLPEMRANQPGQLGQFHDFTTLQYIIKT
jgi:hypothetical protein